MVGAMRMLMAEIRIKTATATRITVITAVMEIDWGNNRRHVLKMMSQPFQKAVAAFPLAMMKPLMKTVQTVDSAMLQLFVRLVGWHLVILSLGMFVPF